MPTSFLLNNERKFCPGYYVLGLLFKKSNLFATTLFENLGK